MLLFVVFSRSEPPLGALPSLWKKYEKSIDYEKHTFRCFDRKKVINLSYLNDNYKDCDDGSDEPGTMATGGTFYCRNERNTPKEIPKWLVSDGNCDCCDGSDEFFNPRVECPNTCKDFDKERKYLITELEATFEEGMQEQEKIIENSMNVVKESEQFIEKNRGKIEKLNQTLISLKQKINETYSNSETVQYSGVKKMINMLYSFTSDDSNNDFFKSRAEKQIKETEKELKELTDKYERANEIASYPEDVQIFVSLRNKKFSKGEYSFYPLGIATDKHHSLGKFTEYSNHTLIYKDGDYCFATKKGRETNIEGHCWKESKLVDVHEIETCNYKFIFGSPVFCNAESFKMARRMTLAEVENYTKLYKS